MVSTAYQQLWDELIGHGPLAHCTLPLPVGPPESTLPESRTPESDRPLSVLPLAPASPVKRSGSSMPPQPFWATTMNPHKNKLERTSVDRVIADLAMRFICHVDPSRR